MKNNKRRYKRFKVGVLEINGMMMFANEVEILDLSVGGVSLRADRRLNMGAEYSLKIGDKTNVIPLKARVVWSLLSGTKKSAAGGTVPMYTAGMRFCDLSGETMAELTQFITDHRNEPFENDVHGLSGLRLNIRFSINAKEKAVLNYAEGYRVKKISLGGMLIESAHAVGAEERLSMELSLPGNAAIVFWGRVASCLLSSSEEPLRYDVGIEFLDLNEAHREILDAFISTLPESDEGLSRRT